MIDITQDNAALKRNFTDEDHLLTPDDEIIIRARDMLMRQRNIDSEAAYNMLVDMAFKRNMPVFNLSIQLIETAKRLTV
jgi:response regulator NasT